MGALWQDLKYGIRTLLQRPGFTAVAALTLALGIGANAAIFSVVNGVLLRSLPYKDPDRLVLLWEANERKPDIHVSAPNFADWREQSRSFEALSVHMGRWGGRSTITGSAEPERAFTVRISRDFFNVLGITPVVGRALTEADHRPDSTPVAVVSYGFWQRGLGGAVDLADRTLTVDGTTYNVVGVMPQGFSFPSETDLWMPIEPGSGGQVGARSSHNFVCIARLKEGVTLNQAQSEMAAIAKGLESQYPNSNRGMTVAVVSMEDQIVGSIRPALLVLLVAVGFVLLIACANVANLLLARALYRQKEIAIRTALGASRGRIIRQLLTESALLSVAGGTFGLVLAAWLVDVLIALSPGTIPRTDEIRIDGRVVAFTFGVSLLTSLLFGLLPALKLSRPDLNESLKESSRGTSSRSTALRSVLVVSEVALTLVLLIGAGLVLESFCRLMGIQPGFNSAGVLTMQLALPSSEYKEEHQTAAFYRQLFERLGALPEVRSAGMVNNLPMGGVNINGEFEIEGRPADQPGYAGFRIISPGYFETLSIPLVKGRFFAEQDTENAMPVAILSRQAAEAAFPNEDPIGKRVRSGMDNRPDVWMTVVGIVGDVRHSGLEKETSAELYVPYAQRPARARGMSVVMRTAVESVGAIAAVRREVHAVDKDLPVSFTPMAQVFARSVAARRYNMILLGTFAALALALSLIGIYGVMSYAVVQGTREIGIRMALGASRGHVLRMVAGQGLTLAAIGLAVGIAGAFGLTRLMENLLFGVTPTDPLTFIGVSALLLAVAFVACYVPARRATKVDPMIALRHE